jgi:hypothetical protein
MFPLERSDTSLEKGSIMSIQTVARQFVDLCRQGKNFDVMRTMYAPNIVSVEADGKETAGQGPVIKKSEDWGSDKTFPCRDRSRPLLQQGEPGSVHRLLHTRHHP